jgi:hypothetical protein
VRKTDAALGMLEDLLVIELMLAHGPAGRFAVRAGAGRRYKCRPTAGWRRRLQQPTPARCRPSHPPGALCRPAAGGPGLPRLGRRVGA